MKKFKSLMIPYFIFILITLFLDLILERNFDIKYLISNTLFLNGDVFALNAPLWFLVVLFIIEISYYFIIGRSTKFKILLAIIMSILGYFNKTILPFGIHVTIVAMVYFIIGDISKSYINKINLSISKSIIWLTILGGIFIILGIKNGYVNIYRIQFNNYFIYFLTSILGSLCCLILSKMLLKTKYLKLIFSYIGKNSLIIMCLHYYVIKRFDYLLLNIINFNTINNDNVIKDNIINNNIGFITTTITIASIILVINLKDITFNKNNVSN